MTRSMIQVVIGIGVVAVALSCAEHSSRLQPTAAEATVTEKGEIATANTEFEGTIGKINADKGLVRVEHWPLSKTFKVPPDCQIDVLTNANAVLTQLKVGDAVRVSYSEVGQDLVADRIVRKGKAYDQERKEKMERLDKMLNPSPSQ